MQNRFFRSHRPVMDFIEEHYLGTLDNHTNDMAEKLDSYLKNKDVDLLEVRILATNHTYTDEIVLRALIVNSAKSNNDREGPRAAKSKAHQSTVQK